MKQELRDIEALGFLADQCDEELAIELNRRLRDILNWATKSLEDLDKSPGS